VIGISGKNTGDYVKIKLPNKDGKNLEVFKFAHDIRMVYHRLLFLNNHSLVIISQVLAHKEHQMIFSLRCYDVIQGLSKIFLRQMVSHRLKGMIGMFFGPIPQQKTISMMV
jgi:hypothetical protein